MGLEVGANCTTEGGLCGAMNYAGSRALTELPARVKR